MHSVHKALFVGRTFSVLILLISRAHAWYVKVKICCNIFSSLVFVIVRFLIKLFNTDNMGIVNNCRQYFYVKLPSILWSNCVIRFEKKFAECDNIFPKILASVR